MNAVECAEKASEIFVLSDSFIRIRELIDDDASTIDDIADIILLDPALSATILKLANSSFFNYPGKIDTISKAVLVLGITEVYNLVIAYFTTQAFKDISANSDYLEEFWESAVDCALYIKYLGTELNIQNAERLFILGLLHNIGELVVQQFMPGKVEICGALNNDELPWTKQHDLLNFTYGQCSGELLKLWQIPYSLIEPIRNQDEDNFEHLSIESQLLYLSKRLMLSQNQCSHLQQDELLAAEKLTSLNIDQEMLDKAKTFCDIERLSILSMLSPSAVVIY